MPHIDCPLCGRRMRYVPWKARAGGRYLCHCGYRFWATKVKDHTDGVLPEFRAPRLRQRRAPAVPGDLRARREVMRQWKAQVGEDRRTAHVAGIGHQRLGRLAEQRTDLPAIVKRFYI